MNDRKPRAWVRKNARTKNLHPSKQKWEVIYEDPNASPSFKQRTKGGFKTRALAQGWADDWTDPANPHLDPVSAATPFPVVAREFIDGKHYPKARTRTSLEQILIHNLAPTGVPANFTGPVGDITYVAVRKWVAELSAVRSATTVRNTFYAFRSVMDHAVDTERISINPARMGQFKNMKGVLPSPKPMHVIEEERYDLDADEADAVLSFMPYPYNVYAMLAGRTGMRPEELAGLTVGKYADGVVKVHAVVLRVPGQGLVREELTKNATSRREIPLDTDAAGQLDAYVVEHIRSAVADGVEDLESLPLFVGETFADPIDHDRVVKKYFKPALAKAGLPPTIRFYDLRHARLSALVDAIGREDALTLKEVQAISGHKTAMVLLDRYSHKRKVDVARTRKALDALAPKKTRHLRAVEG